MVTVIMYVEIGIGIHVATKAIFQKEGIANASILLGIMNTLFKLLALNANLHNMKMIM